MVAVQVVGSNPPSDGRAVNLNWSKLPLTDMVGLDEKGRIKGKLARPHLVGRVIHCYRSHSD